MEKKSKALSIILGEAELEPEIDFVALFHEAEAAGKKALAACKPAPMVVEQHTNMLDDNSPVEKAYVVSSGVCGFAWVIVRCKGKGTKFINALKKKGLASIERDAPFTRSDCQGYIYSPRGGGQSYERKCAFIHAFASVLSEAGVSAHTRSRLD